jgi:hypothetical protein
VAIPPPGMGLEAQLVRQLALEQVGNTGDGALPRANIGLWVGPLFFSTSQFPIEGGYEMVASFLCLGSKNVGSPQDGLQFWIKVQCLGTFLGHNRSKS